MRQGEQQGAVCIPWKYKLGFLKTLGAWPRAAVTSRPLLDTDRPSSLLSLSFQ